jgi:hypothetical protein
MLPFTVIVDHRAIQFISNYKGENRQIMDRALFLAEFGDRLVIVHKPGYLFLKADPFSRLLAYAISFIVLELQHPDLLRRIKEATAMDTDQYYVKLIESIQTDALPIDTNSKWWVHEGILHFRDQPWKHWRMYIPRTLRESLVMEAHIDSGHLNFEKIVNRLTHSFWWPRFNFTVKDWIQKCLECLESKSRTTALPGYLRNIRTAQELGRWTTIHCDFLFNLPVSIKTNRKKR